MPKKRSISDSNSDEQTEFYQSYEDLPKDLMKFKKLLMGDRYKEFMQYIGQPQIWLNMKPNNFDICDEMGDQYRQKNLLSENVPDHGDLIIIRGSS